MNPIPAPHFTGQTQAEQLQELRKALLLLIQELNMMLPMLEKGEEKE